jgi:hypothetical protein
MTEALIIALAILVGAFIIYRGLRGFAFLVFESMLRMSLVSNFSRFGDIDEDHLAIMEERGYFVRDQALWVADVVDGTLDKTTSRQLDLFDRDSALLKEARNAVEILHQDVQDQFKEK